MRGTMVSTSSVARPQLKAAVWPILIAPLAAGVYYLAVKLAFSQSIVPVMGRSDFLDLPRWGSNWTFRIAAEVIAVSVGTFIAASLARGRERVAAIVGGCTISLGFALKLWLLYSDPDESFPSEPWYQYAIDAGTIVAAPLVALFVAEPTEELHRTSSRGVGGVNRLHFIWLWVVTYFYALGLITPVARIYGMGETNIIKTIITLLINGIPAAALAIPGYYGMAFLAGHHGDTMHPAGRNMVGALVLVFGFIVGAAIEFGWYWMFEKIVTAIFG